jgi:hypothetical protein
MDSLFEKPFYKFCYNCKFEDEVFENICPKCRKPLRSRQQIRVLGGVMLALSLILIVGMAYIIYSMDQSIINSGKPGSTTKWTASPAQISTMFGVLYTVLAIGISAFVAGLWHLVIGRRNLILIWIMFGLTIGLFVFSKFLPE